MQADGRVNLLVELLASFNIVRREPAAHTFILQAFVQTVSKLLVLGRIADEAGIELNRAADQGADVGDELVGKARAPQEDFRDFALGAIDRIYPDRGGSFMAHGLQSFGGAQIDAGKDGRIESSFAEVSLREVRPVEVRKEEFRPAEVRQDEPRPTEVRPAEVRPTEVRPAEVRHDEVRPAEVRPGEDRCAEVRPVEDRCAEDRCAEVRPAEVRLEEVRPDEVRLAEVRPGEARLAEVRPYVRMPLSPLIPGGNSLFQDCQMLFIRHRLSPTAPREAGLFIRLSRFEGARPFDFRSGQAFSRAVKLLSLGWL